LQQAGFEFLRFRLLERKQTGAQKRVKALCVIASPNKVRAKQSRQCVIARSEATKQSRHCLFMRLPHALRALAMTYTFVIARSEATKQSRHCLFIRLPRALQALAMTHTFVIARSEATKQSLEIATATPWPRNDGCGRDCHAPFRRSQ
jgi:hypothetical protein